MSELALQLIEENKKTRSPFLDLGNCGLTEVPEEIGELVWLEELSFADKFGLKWDLNESKIAIPRNDINSLVVIAPRFLDTSLPRESSYNPLINLNCLKNLSLSGNGKLKDLTPLSDLTSLQQLNIASTQVTDLTPLSDLTNLLELNVGFTQVANLKPLAGLKKLLGLNVEFTLVTDLKPLADLNNLHELSVWNTQVTDLRPLSGLTNLLVLNVSHTQVADLKPLTSLDNLQILIISVTQVSDLRPLIHLIKKDIPVLLGSDNSPKKYIYINGCPLTNPPVEIVKQGNAAIINYFEEQEQQGIDYLLIRSQNADYW